MKNVSGQKIWEGVNCTLSTIAAETYGGFVKSEEKNVRLLLCQEIILKQGDIVIDARNRENIIWYLIKL